MDRTDDNTDFGVTQPAPERAPQSESVRERHSGDPRPASSGSSLLSLNRREPERARIRETTAHAGSGHEKPARADALDADRILELPARRQASHTPRGQQEREPLAKPSAMGAPYIRPLPAPGRSRATRPLVSLGEATQEYATRLASRRFSTAGAESDQSNSRQIAASEAPAKCPLCHDIGYVRMDVPVGHHDFGRAVLCECRERQIDERERLKLRGLSSLKPFDSKTFATFDSATPGMREAFEVARLYASDPTGWLIFQGSYGCGKTHLAAAIAHQRENEGDTVFFSIVPDLLDHLRAAFAPNSDITYDALFDRIREAGLLVLDDLGAENSTAWATEKLFQIINYRYNFRMPTVITTNARLLAHMDERIRSRLSDRGLVRMVVIEAKDYRERHAGPGARGGSSGPRGRGYPR